MYDERAVSYIERIERLLAREPPRASRELGSLLGTLEIHIEDGDGVASVVEWFERIFCEFATLREVDAATVEKARGLLHELLEHVRAHGAAQSPSRRR